VAAELQTKSQAMSKGPAESSHASQSAPGISTPAVIISDAILAEPAACATELAANAARTAIIMRRAKKRMKSGYQ